MSVAAHIPVKQAQLLACNLPFGFRDSVIDSEVLKLWLWFCCSVPELDCNVIIHTSVTHWKEVKGFMFAHEMYENWWMCFLFPKTLVGFTASRLPLVVEYIRTHASSVFVFSQFVLLLCFVWPVRHCHILTRLIFNSEQQSASFRPDQMTHTWPSFILRQIFGFFEIHHTHHRKHAKICESVQLFNCIFLKKIYLAPVSSLRSFFFFHFAQILVAWGFTCRTVGVQHLSLRSWDNPKC